MEEIKQIASRIKEMRLISGLSPEKVALDLGIPDIEYLTFEEGTVDIPVSYLYRLAGIFNVELTTLITGEEPRLRHYTVTRKGRGKGVNRRKQYNYQNLAYNYVKKKAEPFLVEVPASSEDSPIEYNSHPGQEFNYVLEGRLKVIINGYELILEAGDSLYYDSGIDHAMKALDNKPSKFLAVIL